MHGAIQMHSTILLIGLFATIPITATAEDVSDTPEGAKSTSKNRGIKETLISATDVDFFRFDVSKDRDYPERDASGNITVTLSQKAPPGANPLVGWQLDLYSEKNFATPLYTATLPETRLDTQFEQGLSLGRYYYKVSSVDSGGFPTKEYTIQGSWEESTQYEKPPNDNTGAATAIRANEAYYGNLSSPSDIDVYRLTLQAPDSVTITLSQEMPNSDSTIGWQLRLLSPSLLQQEIVNVPSTTLKGTMQVNLEVGMHYIFVQALPPSDEEEETQAPVGRKYQVIANAPNAPVPPENCEFIFTYAQNPVTQHWAMFPTLCDVPPNWVSQTTLPELFEVCPSRYATYTFPDQNTDGIGMLKVPYLDLTDGLGNQLLVRIEMQQEEIQQTPEGIPLYRFQLLPEKLKLIRVLKEAPVEESPAPETP